MEEIAISKFKATCLASVGARAQDGPPDSCHALRTAIARVSPPEVAKRVPRLGGGAGTMVVLGDIVGPIGDESIGRSLRIGDRRS